MDNMCFYIHKSKEDIFNYIFESFFVNHDIVFEIQSI